MPARTLRSKAARALLWRAADGRCVRCGQPLGDDWEADHIVPWSARQRTNVHEMQALCRQCNRKKGSRMLRDHQKQFLELCHDIKTGAIAPELVVLEVTPGGGKQYIPQIAASELIPTIGDIVAWVTPRLTLQIQGEESFGDPHSRHAIGHRLEIRQSTNDLDPSRGTTGYVTTYQAIGSDGGRSNWAEFERKRVILILDEPHHVEDGGAWHRALQPLVDRAALVVLMSGTLERGDGKRIAFLPYKRVNGGIEPDLTSTDSTPVIRYGRRKALEERAIKRLEFRHLNGVTTFVLPDGQSVFTELSDTKYSRESLFTALHTDYARQLLEQAVDDWRGYRDVNPFAKLLVVAPTIELATTFSKWLHALGIDRCGIATSKDSPAALETIARYKKGSKEVDALDVLVTVQMAYEGLDVPEITHIACLTHIRSRPWLEQMFGRAARVVRDWGSWEAQFGMIHAPDDALFAEVIEQIKRDQSAFVADPIGRTGPGPGQGVRETIAPISGEATDGRAAGMNPGEWLTTQETDHLLNMAREYGVYGTPLGLDRMFRDKGVDWRAELAVDPRGPAPTERYVPLSVREDRLRKAIEKYCRGFDHDNGLPFGKTSTMVKRTFGGKARESMREDELIAVWTWLQQNCQRTLREASDVYSA